MKEVMAIIRIGKVNQTKRALIDAGISSMNAKECFGRGKGYIEIRLLGLEQQEYEEHMDDPDSGSHLIPKRLISIVVPDSLVSVVVGAIVSVNKTGKSGDGKIFVMPVMDSYRIRSGDHGDETLD
ncbi:MAG: P-II family nitrogen regulator [Treponema sp.]|jgi:nitrogen regulatory protein PII 2|nr:P-II family nitrogen regulator [Treponema sp.]